MGVLKFDERQTLIGLLQKLPGISSDAGRRSLLGGLPNGLIQSIHFSGSASNDISAIVDTVDSDTWAQLTDNSWSVIVVLDNAQMWVRGSRLEIEIRTLKEKLLIRLEPPATPPNNAGEQAAIPLAQTQIITAPPAPHAAHGRLETLSAAQKDELVRALLNAFPQRADMSQMVTLGLDENLNAITSELKNLKDAAFELVEWALKEGRVEELVLGAWERVPRNPKLRVFVAQYVEGPPIIARPDVAAEGDIAIERIVNKAANFSDVEEWLKRMRMVINTVCRVEIPKPEGTGFLIAKDIVITNYHVVKSLLDNKAKMGRVVLRFDYRADAAGLEVRKGVTYKLAPEPVIYQSPIAELDMVLLRVDGAPGEEPIGGQSGAPSRGWNKPFEHELVEHQPLFVVQHPEKQPLKVAFGTVLPKVLPGGLKTPKRRVRYDIPTLGGSSGSPCFNDQWELVALHQGGENREPARFNEGIPFKDILEDKHVRKALGL